MIKTLQKAFWAFTRSERTAFYTVGILAFISGILTLVLFVGAVTTLVPAAGGEYTEGVVGQPTHLNPILATSGVDKDIVRLVFANLNALTEKIDASKDGRTRRVRLKEGLLWQDGEKLTSDDVVFTVEKIQDPESQSPLFSSWQGVAANRLSELEVQFTLVTPYAFFADNLKDLMVIPKHLFAEVPPANWRLSEYNLKPVGSGPYEFVSYEKRLDGFVTAYHLKADSRYAGGQAEITNFNFQFFTSADDLIKNFNSGRIDGIPGLTPYDLSRIKRPYRLLPFRLPGYYAVFFNQSKSLVLKDDAVRRALALSIDKNSLVARVLENFGDPAYGPIPEGGAHFDPELREDNFSPEAASALLEKAGWKMSATGFRGKTVNNTTINLEFTLMVPQINFLTEAASSLQSSWKKIGINVNLSVQPLDDVLDNAIKNRDYEALLFGNFLDPNSDLFSFWHSSERFYPGLNLSIYQNKKADALIEGIRQNLDSMSRENQFYDLQKIIVGDTPAVFLFSPNYLYVASKILKGPEGGYLADPSLRFADMSTWYVKTTRVLK